jgi:hypothetical protein
MVTNTRCVRIFLSSPSDLARERNVVSEVCQQLNIDMGRLENFSIELMRWESHTFSAKGNSPQDIITSQIGDEYDIFLGMLGGKFGTPTREFGSGTEEEFAAALRRNKETGCPEIMFLFSEASRKYGEIDAAQLLKVQEFKKTLSPEGVLYSSFENEMQLWRLLYSQILNSVRVVLDSIISAPSMESSYTSVSDFDPLEEWRSMLASDSEVNASVLIQMAAVEMSGVNVEIMRLNKSTGNLTKDFKRETPKFSGVVTVKNIKLISESIMRITTAIKNSNRDYLEIIPKLHGHLKGAMVYSHRSVSIFKARGEMTSQIAKSLYEPLVGFRQTFGNLASSLDTTEEAIGQEDAPGTAFSIERRKFIALVRDLRRVIQSSMKEMAVLEKLLEEDNVAEIV